MKSQNLPRFQGLAGDVVVFLTLVLLLPTLTHGHGRMWDPPSRQSGWRSKFPIPPNYDDHGMNCGGRVRQWGVNGGKCGICGDPWDGERKYERPYGSMVQHNVIPTTYTQGQTIDVTVQVTANHRGWFEFRICDIASTESKVEATWACLNRTLLSDTHGLRRFYLGSDVRGFVTYKLVLPPWMTCAHCLVQWKWHCGNSKGMGIKQEEFFACSDVTILRGDGGTFPTVITMPTTTTTTTTTTSTTPRIVPTSAPTTSTTTRRSVTTTPMSHTTDDHDEDDDHMFESFLHYFKKQTKVSRMHDDDDNDAAGDNSPDNPNLFCTLCRFRCNFFGCSARCPQDCRAA